MTTASVVTATNVRAAVVAGLAVIALAGCSELSGPEREPLRGAIEDAELRLENTGSRTLFYFAVEPGVLINTLWVQCLREPDCPRLEAGESVRIPLTEVVGWSESSTSVVVFWWRAVPGPTWEPTATEPKSIVIAR